MSATSATTNLLHSSTIRRCLVADPGNLIFSCDFDQIEMRIAGAMSGEPNIIDAARRGESIHKIAAELVFGPTYTKDQYRNIKALNFGWMYGGGPTNLATQTGIPYDQAKWMITKYEREFSRLSAFKRDVQERVLERALGQDYARYRSVQAARWSYKAAGQDVRPYLDKLLSGRLGWVVTPYGRRLLVETEHAYAGLNYLVQSTARDVLAEALLRVMDDPELEPYALLPIHDELLGQAPTKIVEEVCKRYSEVMSTEFLGVPLTASGSVYGLSWGDGYK